MIFNKLVRDRIPEIIRNSGKEPVVRILEGEEYTASLHQKLDEEVVEFHRDRNAQELADILEVVLTLADDLGISREQLIETYEQKHAQRGGFSGRVFLVSDTDDSL